MKLMYMDECKSEHTNVVSLTAVVIDESSYRFYRESIYQALSQWISPDENTFADPPELHGSDFLPAAESDAIRITTAQEIYKVVRESGARIYRCGYYRDPELPNRFKSDASLLQLAFFGIQASTQSERNETLVLPIMDGVDPSIARSFGASNHSTLACISCGLSESDVSIKNMHNIVDPVVSDSRFSVCTQAADLVSYGLHCQEWIRLGLKTNSYKRQLAHAAETLKDSVKMNETIKLQRKRSN